MCLYIYNNNYNTKMYVHKSYFIDEDENPNSVIHGKSNGQTKKTVLP